MLYYTSIILTYVTHLGFLKSPHIILKAVLNIYNLCLAPVVNPVLTFYITLWRIVARTLGYGISFLHIIARFFNKHSSSNDNDKDTSNLESEQGPSSLPWNKSQPSLSCFDNESRKERATSGPKMGGSGGGLLKATIGSAPFSSDTVLLALQLSSLPFFLGSKVGAIPPVVDKNILFSYNCYAQSIDENKQITPLPSPLLKFLVSLFASKKYSNKQHKKRNGQIYPMLVGFGMLVSEYFAPMNAEKLILSCICYHWKHQILQHLSIRNKVTSYPDQN